MLVFLSRSVTTVQSLGLITFGSRCCDVVGITDLSWRLMNNCAGEPMLSIAVFLYSSKPKYGSVPSCSVCALLFVLTSQPSHLTMSGMGSL